MVNLLYRCCDSSVCDNYYIMILKCTEGINENKAFNMRLLRKNNANDIVSPTLSP